jgi:hypothetical protein
MPEIFLREPAEERERAQAIGQGGRHGPWKLLAAPSRL